MHGSSEIRPFHPRLGLVASPADFGRVLSQRSAPELSPCTRTCYGQAVLAACPGQPIREWHSQRNRALPPVQLLCRHLKLRVAKHPSPDSNTAFTISTANQHFNIQRSIDRRSVSNRKSVTEVIKVRHTARTAAIAFSVVAVCFLIALVVLVSWLRKRRQRAKQRGRPEHLISVEEPMASWENLAVKLGGDTLQQAAQMDVGPTPVSSSGIM
ncbi:hypothetical protein B0H13DRAFT_2354916 [Mycena leptocephala]|nr:hypothetical protein B0H13DRAFT_2354916 [Mycena leptocephala]